VSENSKALLRDLVADLKHGKPLPAGAFRRVLDTLTNEGTDAQKGALLGVLSAYEHMEQAVPLITEAARFLREHPQMGKVTAPEGTIDIVGTGGDGQSTFNISTASAFVVAGAGVPVAKHGNRAVSSRSGASDVLAALGVKLDVPPETVERAINEAGVGFLWAPQHHPAMKEWAKVRGELGFRTLFNLLGPLCNPALVKRQIIGVYAREWVRPVAEVMKNLGADHVWVVHGADGLDELTTTTTSFVAELKNGSIREFEIAPEEAGLPRASPVELRGGDAAVNAAALRAVLAGQPGAYRDIVLLNSAAALVIAGKATSLADGVTLAARSIGTGKAGAALDALVKISTESA
jgi:anthranilate phosphoribosyltransferase